MATLKELAELVGGTVVGDGECRIERLATLDTAGPGDITFVSNPKYLKGIAQCKASAVIVAPGIEVQGFPLIVCSNPYLAFAKVLTFLQVRRPEPQGIMAGAIVHPGARLGRGVTVHPGCVVGEDVSIGDGTIFYPGVIVYDRVAIGADCLIHAGVVIREECRLGDRVIIQPSVVIGCDGFGFAPDGSGYYKIPQVGIVVVEDDVEIGSGSCIDRAALGVTLIGRGTKIDNLVHIAHNVVVGEDNILCGQVGIAGSTRIGRHCTFGGQAGLAGHVRIGDNVTIGAQGGVAGNLEGNQVLSGSPVIPHKDWVKASLTFGRLPEMRKEMNRMKRQLAELEMLIQER